MHGIHAVNGTLLLFNFIMMQIFRFSHPGKVCSGDYLTDENDMTD
eukprot:CAMPEP_0116885260 /NCGR_PEP_ID=MMETSP0463-20121206/18551_1 /TAXON_ID=181622 /ORGANISM="Strombidinopsis sp, Strain SopsisLIS2011" /LENGTH=44 /DNA_ID= /DNA_START= /DNA_END= /DNA_ORIENTATION=